MFYEWDWKPEGGGAAKLVEADSDSRECTDDVIDVDVSFAGERSLSIFVTQRNAIP